MTAEEAPLRGALANVLLGLIATVDLPEGSWMVLLMTVACFTTFRRSPAIRSRPSRRPRECAVRLNLSATSTRPPSALRGSSESAAARLSRGEAARSEVRVEEVRCLLQTSGYL